MVTMFPSKKVFAVASMREENLAKVVEDIVDAVKKSNLTGNQEDIVEILNERKVNLGTRLTVGGRRRTVLRMLLEDCVNADKIIEELLDQNVRRLEVNENSIEYGTEIDFGRLFETDGSLKQMLVVKELLDLRASSREGEQREAFTRFYKSTRYPNICLMKQEEFIKCHLPQRLIGHPVIASLVHTKWRKTQW